MQSSLGTEQKVKTAEQEIKDFNQSLLTRHRLAVVAIAALIYFFDKDIFKAFLIGSIVFNLYLVMLCFGFAGANLITLQAHGVNTDAPKDNEEGEEIKVKPSTGLYIIYGLRIVITATILALLIVKLKLSLIGLAIAFIAYKVVLLVSGFLNKSRQQ